MTLSKESDQFLRNLQAYLLVSGKKESEIFEITSELERELLEAEKDGKSVEDIIGKSPETYMESIGHKMKTDVKQSVFAGLAIIFGAFSIAIFPDIVQGEITFSLFKLVGMFAVFILFTIALVKVAKKLSSKNAMTSKTITFIFILFILPMFVFIGLFLLDKYIKTPVFSIHAPTVYIIGAVILCFLIWLSIWSRTWIILIVVTVLTLPELLQKTFQLTDETNLYITAGLFVLLSLGIFYNLKKSTKSSS